MTQMDLSLLQRRTPTPLAPLKMPAPQVTLPTGLPNDELVEEGRELFQNFLLDEIQREEKEISLEELSATISTPAGYKNPLWAKTGRELRHMADEFAKTSKRKELARKASMVDVISVTAEQFRDLLSELFQQGDVTNERIMVLFIYCSDLAVRGLRVGASVCRQVVNWSLQFISDTVCRFVQGLGGWSRVLTHKLEIPVVYVVATAVVAVVGTVLVMNYWKK